MSMTVLGIDPGSASSAIVAWDGRRIDLADDMPNAKVLEVLRSLIRRAPGGWMIAIEGMFGYGVKAGIETFETCYMIGRVQQLAEDLGIPLVLVHRKKDVMLHYCDNMTANDSHLRQALIREFGEPGTKKAPGLLYPLNSTHLRSAFAIAALVYEREKQRDKQNVGELVEVI
jgi:hypothetical protein